MPALATIEPPNMRSAPVQTENVAEPKKKPKASSLCYTPPAMINDKKRDRSYFRRGLLGEGGFARCFEVTDFQGTRLAAKCVAKKSITSEKVKMKLLGEIKVHKSMDHPNIVRQRDCFEDDVNVYMILDICTNGTLMDMLRNRKRFTEPEVRYFGLQILGAVKYMHSRRVIHRDLKLGNLFLDENMCIKVGDFGLAALLVDDDDRKKTFCGTPNYIAPEVLFGSGEGHSYEVDLWSIGVIFYAMLIGKPPFQSKDVKAIYAKIRTNEYEFPLSAEVSSNARDLITSLLCTDPQNRPSIDDIASHRFFNHGIMPRSIPPSATKIEPRWPEGQATSVFKRNLNYVSVNSGIGLDQAVGREQGQVVDVKVERPESGRYLPVSLSPRTGPAAKMVNLQTERAGGRTDSLTERLKSVQLEDDTVDSQKSLDKNRARELRKTTLGAGALRSQQIQKENVDPINVISSKDKPRSNLGGAVRTATTLSADTSEEKRSVSSRLRGATRVVSEPTRPITRSSRFTQAQNLADLRTGDMPDSQAPNNLSKPIRRAVSAYNQPSESQSQQESEVASRATTMPSRRTTRRDSTSPELAVRSSSRATSEQDAALLSRPVSRVDDVARASNKATRNTRTTTRTSSGSIWESIKTLADCFESALIVAPDMPDRQTAPREMELVYISKWVDYSHRYGLGYQLSNESTGVYFNDATSIILPNRSSEFDFITSSGTSEQHSIDSPTKELEKKVYLLKHFRGYMTTHLNNAAALASSSTHANPKATENCYMTHYWRTKAGILFRLSDGTLQLNFTDHSKLMIPAPFDAVQCTIRYVDVDKVTRTRSLGEAVHDVECREKIECASKIFKNFAKLEGRGGGEAV